MKHFRIGVPCMLACLWLASAAFGLAQEMPPSGAPEQMKEIAFMVGHWKTDNMQYRMAADTEWETTSMTMQVESILDGCAHHSSLKGRLLGTDFHGIATISYNRETGKWQSSWIDNYSATQVLSQGEFKEGTMSLTGKNSQMGQEYWIKEITKKVSDREIEWRLDSTYDGQNWYTVMKATYRKQ